MGQFWLCSQGEQRRASLSANDRKTFRNDAMAVLSLRPNLAIASTDSDPGHRLENDVKQRLKHSLIRTTYDSTRTPRRRDLILRTDGYIWQENGFEGVLFEVGTRKAALS